MLPHLLRLGLFLFALCLTNPANSAPLPPDKLPGGWQEVELNGAAIAYRFAASDTLVTVRTYSNTLLLIDAADGVVKEVISKPATLANDSDFAKSAGFIDGRLVVVSPTRSGLRIDEYNPSLSRWERSASIPDQDYYQDYGPPIVFRGEIRVQGADSKIRRWSQGDWSPLPALPQSTPSSISYAPVAMMFGDLYFKGYSSNQLFFEGPTGAEVTAKVPLPHMLDIVENFTASESYMIASVDHGFLVWNRLNPTASPRFQECGYQAGSIMNDRFLIAYYNGRLEVRDLKNPSRPPIDLEAPGSFWTNQFTTIGNGVWRYTQGQTPSVCHLQLPVSSQAVKISVVDANAHERNGVLEFEVKAEQTPSAPITVTVETSSGTALEGVDYEKSSQTVTLTPLASSAKVRINILQDNIVEGYETMFLKVTGVSDGWCMDTDAVGTIIGTGLVQVASTEAAAFSSISSVSFLELESGLILWDRNKGYLNFCLRGQLKWVRLKSTGTLTLDNILLTAENKNHLLVATGWNSLNYREIDPTQDTLVSTGSMPYPSSLGQKVILNDELYLVQKLQFGQGTNDFEIRRRSDSGFVRLLKKPTDMGNRLITGANGTAVFEGLIFHRLAPDGTDLYQRLEGVEVSAASMGADGIGITGSRATNLGTVNLQVIDSATATIMESIEQPENMYGGTAGGRSHSRLQQNGVVKRFERLSGLPAPVQRSVSISESDKSSSIKLDFTEASEHPVTVSISAGSSSGDLKISSLSATLVPGQRTLSLPISVTDDEVPEGDESHNLLLKVTSNGVSAEFDFRVTIKDNDVFALDIKHPVSSTAADVGKGYPIFGFAGHKAMADPVTESLLTPKKPNNLELFAHTVAGSSGLAVSGAPAYKNATANSVYIFDRKKKKLLKQITYNGAGSGFGATLLLTNSQLFVGAPGNKTKTSGFVSSYTVPGGKAVKSYKQPGSAKVGNLFGTSMASNTKTVWIGAPGAGAGMVYQFDVITGKLLRTLKPPVSGVSNFGHSMVTCGSFVAISAPSADASSSVFIYQLGTGKYVGRITTPFSEGGLFGASLAELSGNRLAIGCPKPKMSKPGAVLIYDISKKPFHLITMVSPTPATTGYGVVGNTGSLSGHGSFLMMQFHLPQNGVPLAPAYDGSIPRGQYAQVVAISNKAGLKKDTPATGLLSMMPADIPSAALEEPGTLVKRYEIEMTFSGNSVLISTTAIGQPPSGTIMTLEASDNLVDWRPLAKISSDSSEWALEKTAAETGVVFDADKREIQVPVTSGSGFFRLSMEVDPNFRR